MKLLIFSVYDSAAKAYLQPFYARSKGEAIRSFSDACNNAEHNFRKHYMDYTMVYLGEFDDNSGVFAPSNPERVIGANECIADDVFTPDKEVRTVSN